MKRKTPEPEAHGPLWVTAVASASLSFVNSGLSHTSCVTQGTGEDQFQACANQLRSCVNVLLPSPVPALPQGSYIGVGVPLDGKLPNIWKLINIPLVKEGKRNTRK